MAGWKAIAFTGCVFVSSSSCVPTTATRPLRLSAGQDRIADLGEGIVGAVAVGGRQGHAEDPGVARRRRRTGVGRR